MTIPSWEIHAKSVAGIPCIPSFASHAIQATKTTDIHRAPLSPLAVWADDPSFEEIDIIKTKFDSFNLVNAGDGYFYGVARFAQANNGGAIFRIAPGQQTEVLHTFSRVADDNIANYGGANPTSGLVLGPDGAFYGATQDGGAYASGTIYRYSADGVFSVVHDIGQAPGEGGYINSLVFAPDGYLYGVAQNGGQFGKGAILRVSTGGTYETLYTFGQPDPGGIEEPVTPQSLALGSDGKLYGVTLVGGTPQAVPVVGSPPLIASYGNFFRYDAPGEITVLANFDAQQSNALQCVATTGGFYVTTGKQLVHLDLAGTKTQIVDFKVDGKGGDSINPGSIVQTADGIYGVTYRGGEDDGGFCYRYVAGEGLTYLHDFGMDYRSRSRSLVVGNDDLVYGVAGYPEEDGSAARSTATNAKAKGQAKAKAKAGKAAARSFRFRDLSLPSNFVPIAKPDKAWLPAKAVDGKREIVINVLANDRDRDRDRLTLGEIGEVVGATVTIAETPKGPRLRFTTTEADPASRKITYQVLDGKGGVSTGTVALLSPATGRFKGTATSGESTGGELLVTISKQNAVSATFTTGGRKYTGKASLDLDDSADIALRSKGRTSLNLHLALERGTARQLNATVAIGSDTYTATCTPVAK
ncbi:choice-of-anchor tandem repeat GloVer-containing protein [Luteolibacter sp. Populi]|uniref:choice-of-anchor tandem repeat GloVer-containing protein n=1 Tax=Luteolibacter sp. Populi TaxID=3230487 RepID=UPI00346622A9